MKQSVSQPRCATPVLASMLPNIPNLDAMTTSCSAQCPASVVWLGSILI